VETWSIGFVSRKHEIKHARAVFAPLLKILNFSAVFTVFPCHQSRWPTQTTLTMKFAVFSVYFCLSWFFNRDFGPKSQIIWFHIKWFKNQKTNSKNLPYASTSYCKPRDINRMRYGAAGIESIRDLRRQSLNPNRWVREANKTISRHITNNQTWTTGPRQYFNILKKPCHHGQTQPTDFC